VSAAIFISLPTLPLPNPSRFLSSTIFQNSAVPSSSRALPSSSPTAKIPATLSCHFSRIRTAHSSGVRALTMRGIDACPVIAAA
jgi:hypothetical protein